MREAAQRCKHYLEGDTARKIAEKQSQNHELMVILKLILFLGLQLDKSVKGFFI